VRWLFHGAPEHGGRCVDCLGEMTGFGSQADQDRVGAAQSDLVKQGFSLVTHWPRAARTACAAWQSAVAIAPAVPVRFPRGHGRPGHS
jgi:hypothetical protein